jgi:hypothetical protein
MWMDDALWKWQSEAAARRAQIWVKHVMVADHLGRPQGYEFEGELVLVGIRIPSRQVESLLLQAGFRPSLATWRAKASDERRRRLPEFVAWLANDGPEEPRLHPPEPPPRSKQRHQGAEGSGAARLDALVRALPERARHRGAHLSDARTAHARRPRARPHVPPPEQRRRAGAALRRRRLTRCTTRRPRRSTTQTVVREGLAWEEYPEFVTAVGDAIKPRSAPRKSAQSSPRSPAKQAATKATNKSPLPEEKREEAREQIGDLVLPPSRRSSYLARVEKAAGRGENPKRLLTEASKESREFMRERAANRSQEPTWDESIVRAFEQEPGWRLDVVPRGPGHVLTVYPDDGALVDAVVSIDVRDNAIGDVRWLPRRPHDSGAGRTAPPRRAGAEGRPRREAGRAAAVAARGPDRGGAPPCRRVRHRPHGVGGTAVARRDGQSPGVPRRSSARCSGGPDPVAAGDPRRAPRARGDRGMARRGCPRGHVACG